MQATVNKSQELTNRMLDFSVAIINLTQNIDVPKSVSDQILRSATSIGANYSEAINASSKADFKNKIYIAKKEAAETKYWLELIARLDSNVLLNELKEECHLLLMILQKTVNTLNDKGKIKDK